MKRLGQVVVGAEFQAVNPLLRIAMGGEKDDRGLRHGGAQFARQVESIAVGSPTSSSASCGAWARQAWRARAALAARVTR